MDGHIKAVEDVLARSNTCLVNVIDSSGMTSLHYSCARGYKHIVSTLLNHGASLFVEDHFHKTPLHHACHYQYENIVEYILKTRRVNLSECPVNVR